MTGLSAPLPLDLPDRLRDPAPEVQRAAIAHLAGAADWIALDWPELLEELMALGRADIPLSRLVEGHIDALRILAEADAAPAPGALYGVWASRSGDTGLTGRWEEDDWRLSGRLMFTSGAQVIDRTLVTVATGPGNGVLLDADVTDWRFDTGAWRTRAMEHSRSHRVDLDGPVTAHRVGPDNFYLDRWGFFPGGVGVAAVWVGAAARLLDLLGSPPEGVPAKHLRWGRARADLAGAVATVRQAGLALHQRPERPRRIATTCRAVVGAAVRRVLDETRTIAGPAGLAFDEPLTRAVDDLAMYVAQQSPDGDALFLGAT